MTNETTAPVQSLHDQIMRLQCTPPKDANVNQMLAYKSGHRDARHAAAELAAAYEADAQQAAPVSVPDGWKMVPVDATGEMVGALKTRIGVTSRGGILNAGHALNAAIDAAPTPPAGPWESPCTQPAQQPVAWVLFHNGEVAYDRDELIICNLPGDRLDESYEWRRVYADPPAQQSPLYTCIGKGGRYEKVGSAKPAGIAHFEHNIGEVIVYRDIESDHLYFRLPLDFNRRMKRIDDGDTAAPEQRNSDEIHQIAFEIGGTEDGGYHFSATELDEFVARVASAKTATPEQAVFRLGYREGATVFASYLLDNCERETVYEENLQQWLDGMLRTPPATPALELAEQDALKVPRELKDGEFRDLVNELRDIACEYYGTEQLREMIAHALRRALLGCDA